MRDTGLLLEAGRELRRKWRGRKKMKRLNMSVHGYLLFHFGNFFEGEKYAMRTIPVLAVNKSEGLKVEVRTSSGPQLKYNRDHFAILYTLEM